MAKASKEEAGKVEKTAPAEMALIKEKAEKAPVKKTATKEKAAKGPGVISTIVESITRKPLSKTEILDILVKKFPDRSPDGMRATVSIQLGPTRLGSKFKLLRDGDKFHIAG